MAKFEEKEVSIAKAENTLLDAGKYVSTEFEENHILHMEVHEKGGDNMLVKRHMENHASMMKDKLKQQQMEVEAKMCY